MMGIQGLMKLICDYSPSSIKDHAIKNYFGKLRFWFYSVNFRGHSAEENIFCPHIDNITGRVVAIDASMSLYQFLIAVRTGDGVLTSSDGETTR